MDLTEFLAVLALALGWLLFRIDRASRRRDELKNARTQLEGVRSTYELLDLYFTFDWDDKRATERADGLKTTLNAGSMEAIHPVTHVDSIRNLVASPYAGTLIDSDLVKTANEALWRIGVFNSYVDLHTQMLATHHPMLAAASQPEKDAIVDSMALEFKILHFAGVASPSALGGWYQRLKNEVSANLARLDCDLRWFPGAVYPRGEALLLVFGDVIALAAFVLALVFLVV